MASISNKAALAMAASRGGAQLRPICRHLGASGALGVEYGPL